MADQALSTRAKALAINLDPLRYGTFAEIGAGQEVVRWFFEAGGAAGTIAKSAYPAASWRASAGPSNEACGSTCTRCATARPAL
jgi:hypothetical protein